MTRTHPTPHSSPIGVDLVLVAVAAIWGFAFVAQRAGMEHVGPLTFNGVRFALGGLALLPVIRLRERRIPRPSRSPVWVWKGFRIPGAPVLGTALFLGSALQQMGMVHTTAGKAGFITGLYVVLVPVFGLFWGYRSGPAIWTASVISVWGLYFLSVTEAFTVGAGDLLVLAGTVFWAVHVHLVGFLAPQGGALRLAAGQFFTCSAWSCAAAAAWEKQSPAGLALAAIPIAYGGLMSVGVAYTLQVLAQRSAKPAHAAFILSLETVFAAIGGWAILGETLTARALVGCAMIFAGMTASQWDRLPDVKRPFKREGNS